MVDGGGLAPEEGRPWRLKHGGNTIREAAGLSLAARPEEDEGRLSSGEVG
jgi:hypothetical protein